MIHLLRLPKKVPSCGQTNKEGSEFPRRSCFARTPVGIMETQRGKASAPSAGERDHAHLDHKDKIRGGRFMSNTPSAFLFKT